MSKSKKSAPSKPPAPVRVPAKAPDRSLMGVNPLQEQFEPTPSNPIPQHKRMAGA